MEFIVSGDRLDQLPTACVVVGVYQGGRLSPSALELDAACGHVVTQALTRGDLDGEIGTTLLLANLREVACERLLLVGLGPEGEFVESSYHAALCAATRTLRTTGARDATFCLGELAVNGRDAAWRIEQLVLAVMDGMYRLDKLKSESPKQRPAFYRH